MDLGPGSPDWKQLRAAWAEFTLNPRISVLRGHWRQGYGLLALTIGAALIASKFVSMPGKAPDFTVFWAAATHAFGPVYDSTFITPLQNALPGPRPFANPPTFLLMLFPFGLLPFKAAYVVWVSASVAAFFAVGLKMTRWAWLAIFSPTLIFVILVGQTTLLAGSLSVIGLFLAGRRSVAAGMALGIAACIKPQLVILAPLALLMLRDVRAFVVAGTTTLALALVATVAFGAEIWSQWIQSLPGFQDITGELAIGQLSLPRNLPILAFCGAAVVALMGLAALQVDRPRLIIATIGGSLLLAPYAAHYESVVLLLPALALLRFDWRILPIGFLLGGWAVTAMPFAAITLILAFPAKWPGRWVLPIRAA